jgi:hypothetical protein
MAKHRVITTDAEIDRALQAAQQWPDEPRLIKAHYSPGVNLVILEFDNQRRLAIPREDVEELCTASQKAAANIEITENGTGLRWPALDLDLYVPNLLKGIYGTRRWMSMIGRRGGSACTTAKRRASRMNGFKGGRPRKIAMDASAPPVSSEINA